MENNEEKTTEKEGNFPTMEDMIRSHLESQALKNPSFARKYKEEHFDKCIEWIYSKAKELVKERKGHQVVSISDNDTYRMAEDFFNDHLEQILEKEEKKKKAEEQKEKLDEWNSIGEEEKQKPKAKKEEPSLFDFDD